MAAISSISNGEALSSVRTKLNSVITEINLLDPTDWIDYSSTSTVVGWSSFTTKIIKYRVIGKQMFVNFNLGGTSNSTTTTFTLPYISSSMSGGIVATGFNINNGITLTTGGRCVNLPNSALVSLGIDMAGNLFSASGTKQINSQFFIEIA